jgi:hypothetical protein
VHEIEMTYEFVIGSKRWRGHVVRTTHGPSKKPPAVRGSHRHWNTQEVDTIEMSHGDTARIYWDSEVFGDQADPDLLLREERDVALVINCEGEPWILHSEPTLDGRIGLIVYNKTGKALLTGTGELVRSARRDKRLRASLTNVFSWRAASPKACAHMTANIGP